MLTPLSGTGVQAALGNTAASSTDTPSKTAPTASAVPAGDVRKSGGLAVAPDRDAVERAVQTLNQNTQFSSQGLRFSIDDETGKTVIKVIDTSTQNVVRQIPSVDALALAHAIDKMQHGLLLREKV